MNMFSYYLARHAPGNVAAWDRVLRAAPAAVVAILFATGVIGGVLAVVLAVAATGLLVTGLTGKCSVYYALGVGTKRDASGTRVYGRVSS